jgi:hypothetical protein
MKGKAVIRAKNKKTAQDLLLDVLDSSLNGYTDIDMYSVGVVRELTETQAQEDKSIEHLLPPKQVEEEPC